MSMNLPQDLQVVSTTPWQYLASTDPRVRWGATMYLIGTEGAVEKTTKGKYLEDRIDFAEKHRQGVSQVAVHKKDFIV